MTSPDLFWAVFAAVLGANILTGAFFWGAITYTRLEKDGREKSDAGHLPLAMMCFCLGLLGLSVFTILY